MLFRKMKKQIDHWIERGTKPLMIDGARQVGKSYLIRESLKESGVEFYEFNFVKDAFAKKIFETCLAFDEETFSLSLETLCGKRPSKGSILFLDEVQEVKEILTLIKFFAEGNKYRYILSGSLLGVELVDLKSAPVGYLDTLDMYPMDLEEFYIANGLSEELISYLRDKFERKEPVEDSIHETLINAFYRYLIVGGMPEAVKEYVNEQDLNKIVTIHTSISREYKRDFTKYEKQQKLKLIKTYELIPSELDSKNKRYVFTDLDSNLKFDRYENNFNWLSAAGVAIPTYNVTEFQIPLERSKKSNLFKMYLSDVGMLSSSYGKATILKLLSHGESVNCGAMFENFVAQELLAHGFPTYYFNSKKHGEVDFLIEYEEELLPIEVKSGKDYTSHSALSYFMETPYFKRGFVFSTRNVSSKGNVIYLPIYMVMFLHNDRILEKDHALDLSRLSL